MACSNFEVAILEYLENELPEAQRVEVGRHLASCTECRAFAAELRDLDAAFSRQIKAPALSKEFNVRLAQRIQSERVAMSAAERAERKKQMELEFRAEMGQLRRSMAAIFLDGVGLAVVVGILAWLFWGVSKGVAAASYDRSVTLLTITGGICLVLGVLTVVSQPIRRYLTAG